jgi:hypothetical protein
MRQLHHWDRVRDDHVMAEYGLRPSDRPPDLCRIAMTAQAHVVFRTEAFADGRRLSRSRFSRPIFCAFAPFPA